MKFEQFIKLLLIINAVMGLSACRLPPSISSTTDQFVDEVETELVRTEGAKNSVSTSSYIQKIPEAWIGPHFPIKVLDSPDPEPVALASTIDLIFVEPISLAELSHQIATQTKVPVTVAVELQTVELPTMDWSGTAKGALDHITGRLGYSWRVRNGQVEIFHTELGVWTLFVPAINAKWQASVGLSGSVEGGSSGSDLQAQDKVVLSLDNSNFWEQVETSLSGLLTQFGKFTINRLSGELTIIDTPVALNRVAEWVSIKNQELTTQVLVNVDLYEIHQAENAIAGFNLTGFVREAFGNSSAEINFGSDDSGGLVGVQLTRSSTESVDASDIEAILRKSVGDNRVAKLTSTVIRGLNGLPVPVFFGDETSYLKNREVVNKEGTIAIQLVPGKIQDGIAINMLPRILPDSDRIMLNLTVKTTRIKEISRFPLDAGPNDPVIQLPNLESRSALLPVILNSGELLFVAGLDTFRTDNSKDKALFSKESKAKTTRTSLVLLIKPFIIRPNIDFSGRKNWRRQHDRSSFL